MKNLNYLKIENFELKDKIVGVRVDINSPIIDGKVVLNERIIKHSKTIKKLSSLGAKVVILAHQGRFNNSDCVSLVEHKKLLEKQINQKIEFVNEIYSKNVESNIKSLKSGNILLLENLRFSEFEQKFDEKNIKKNPILKLEKLFDYYVFDAFSVSHRKQASVVGFKNIPILAGDVMNEELVGLKNILNIKKPLTYLFGGAKPDDLIDILEIDLKNNKVDKILLSGVIGEIALICNGYKLGLKEKLIEKNGWLNSKQRLQKLLEEFSNKFILPEDIAIFNKKKRIEISIDKINDSKSQKLLEFFSSFDIGKKTVKKFSKEIENSKSVYFKGPAGDFEDENFKFGTCELIKTLAKTEAFTYLGGGHSVTAVESFSSSDKFDYVSLAGGALVEFLSGKTNPGIEILENSFKEFSKKKIKVIKKEENIEKEKQDIFENKNCKFLVIGSNTIDTEVDVPESLKEFHLGDKIKVNDNFSTSVGGGGVNVSVGISRLGGRVSYLGKISEESESKIKEDLALENVGLIESKTTKTPCAKSILIDTTDSDRVILTYRGQNSELDLKDFKLTDIYNFDKFYITSLGGKSFKTIVELAKKIKEKKKNSLICINLSQHLIENEKVSGILKYVDIAIMNFDEGKLLTGNKKVSDVLKSIKKKVKSLVIITDGKNGAYAYDGKQEFFVKAIKQVVVDATGAGDSFGGTFFYFYSNGNSVIKSMELAAKNAANVCKFKGAQTGLMKFKDLI